MVSGMFLAVSIGKLVAAGSVSMGLISGVRWFNTYEWKPKKKGAGNNEPDEIKSLRERVRAGN